MLALLEVLQAGGTHTVDELAARLRVDERTVRRYVAHLTDLDIPVVSLRGRYGGYRLAAGYRLPPLMLTDAEALAVLLGLVARERSGAVTTSAEAATSAAAKLRRVLPQRLRQRLDALLETVELTGPGAPGGSSVSPAATASAPQQAQLLLQLAEATRDRRAVAVRYTDRDGRRSERTVHPYGIVAHSGRWYLTGADSASDQVRLFRSDRITGATGLTTSYDVPADFDAAAHVLSTLARAPYRHEVSLRVQGTVEEVRPLFPAAIAVVEPLGPLLDPAPDAAPDAARAQGRDVDPWVRVGIRAERLEWVPALLAGLDRAFVVERPDALRELVRALAGRLLDATVVDAGPAAS